MDYTYSENDVNFFLEVTSHDKKKHIIEQYINIRKQKNMTQAELAERVGISRTNITRFESGNCNPTLEMMIRIATALDRTVEINLMKVKEPSEMVKGES